MTLNTTERLKLIYIKIYNLCKYILERKFIILSTFIYTLSLYLSYCFIIYNKKYNKVNIVTISTD